MPDRKTSERLDEAVEALMADREPASPLTPRLTALLRVAAELRHLPAPEFKARLKAELAVAAGPSYGPPLRTADEIAARLAAIAGPPRLVAHDVAAAARDLPELAMRFLAPLDAWTVAVSRYATDTPIWERHPAADELLHVIDGGLDVTTLTAAGPVHASVDAGALFVCRQGLWHWPRPRGKTTVLSLTPGEGTAHFQGDAPRAAGEAPLRSAVAPSPDDVWDLAAACRNLPVLAITRATTEAEADDAVRTIGRLADRLVGVMRFSGETPWELHPGGDELLHVLDGEVDVTVLADDAPAHVVVPAGSLFVCPRGLWHRQRPKTAATVLFATPTAATEASWADDPRNERREP